MGGPKKPGRSPLWLAYVPGGRVRGYNRVGDYSYGVYIYAFPVQQSVVALMPGVSPLALLAIALPITVLLAVASWHLVESPALGLLHRGKRQRAVASNVVAAP